MRTRDILLLSGTALFGQRLRTLLTVVAIAIGIASVTLLTSIGEGIHLFVIEKFTQFGTNVIKITPGRNETRGVPGSILSSVKPLTLEDRVVLQETADIKAAIPVIRGNGTAESSGHKRRATILGVSHQLPNVWQVSIRDGRFLPAEDPRQARAFAVLGSRMADELFPKENALGKRIRLAGEPFRVIGVLQERGQFLGTDLDDSVYIPAMRGLEMFNRAGLMEINLLYDENLNPETIIPKLTKQLTRRHGEEDFSFTTQQDNLDNLESILNVLTLAAATLGGISLLVGGVGVTTILTISVKERTKEIGVLISLGAEATHVQLIFLSEALALSAVGGFVGILLGVGGAIILRFALPDLPVHISWHFILIAEVLALLVGLVAGVAPSRQAARMNPVDALRAH
jgi:putative ABC transport system permease protein